MKIYGQQFGPFKDYFEWFPTLGITGIIGLYEDVPGKSNGCGKTQLISVILYALYGEGQFKVITDIINDSAKRDLKDDKSSSIHMYAGIEFKMNNDSYTVIRGYKGGKSYLTVKEGDTIYGDEKTSIGDKESKIKEILGMDYSMFSTVSYAEQRKIDKLMNSDFSDTQEYLYKALNINLAQYMVTTAVRHNNKCGDIMAQKYSSLVQSQDVLDSEEATLKALNNDLKDKDTKALKSKALELTKRIVNLKRVELTIEDNSKALDKLQKDKEDQTNQLNDLKNELKWTNQSGQDLANSIVADKKQVEVVEDHISSLINESIELNTAYKTSEESLNKLKDDKTDLLVSINTLKSSLKSDTEFLHSLESIDSNAKCSRCGNVVTEEHKSKEITDVQSNIFTLNQRIKDLELKLETLNNTIDTNVKLLDATDAKIVKNTSHQNDAEAQLVSIKDRIAAYPANVAKNEKEVSQLSKLISTAEKNIDQIDEKIKDLSTSTLIFDKSELNTYTKELASVNAEIESVILTEGAIRQKQEDIARCQSNIADLKEQVKVARLAHKISINQLSIFKKAANSIFDSSIELINYYANEFFNQVEPDYTIRLYKNTSKKRESITVDFMQGSEKRDYLRFSEGQKVVANIALRIGLAMTIMSRANKKINFICLDEPFESLDEYNRELVKSALLKLSNIFEQIILISHTPDIYDCNQIVKVVMDSSKNSSLKIA